MFKIADADQRKNAQIGPDPDPIDRIGTSLVGIINNRNLNIQKLNLINQQYQVSLKLRF